MPTGPRPKWLVGNVWDIVKKSAYTYYIEQARVHGKLFKVTPPLHFSLHLSPGNIVSLSMSVGNLYVRIIFSGLFAHARHSPSESKDRGCTLS